MYANLRVNVVPSPDGGGGATYYAWRVSTIKRDGRPHIRIDLDANDGGSHAVPSGVRIVDPAQHQVDIRADF